MSKAALTLLKARSTAQSGNSSGEIGVQFWSLTSRKEHPPMSRILLTTSVVSVSFLLATMIGFLMGAA